MITDEDEMVVVALHQIVIHDKLVFKAVHVMMSVVLFKMGHGFSTR